MGDNRARYSYLRRESLEDEMGQKWQFWRRRRSQMAVMAFLGFACMYANRANLSVAILAMVKGRTPGMDELNWNKTVEGLVLSSFFYGYALTQYFGGYRASMVGGVKIFGFGVGVPSILAIFSWYLAQVHYGALMVLRFAEGIIQGICYPGMQDVWAFWIPPLERTGLTAFAHSGAYCGTALAMALSGVIAKYIATPVTFLIFGGIGAIWYGLWLAYFYSSPIEDPYISNRELRFLKYHIDVWRKPPYIPWKIIFTSHAVYALIIAHFAINWGAYTLLVELPMYMQEVWKFDIVKAGLLSSMPYIVLVCSMQFTGFMADYIIVKNLLPVTKMRKMFIATGFLIEGAFLTFIGFTKSAMSSLIMFTLAMMGAALSEPNYFNNHFDLAPKHASILLGICNTIATIPGIVSPTLTGYLTPSKSGEEWRYVFMITGGIYLFAAVFYIIFGSAELQYWALKPESDDDDDINDDEGSQGRK